MITEERFSIHLSKMFDCLVYNKEMIAFRVRMYKERSELFSKFIVLPNTLMIVGSKGEGLSTPYQSDMDGMVFEHDVFCSNNPGPFDILTYPTVFQMDYCDSPPGYTKLKIIKLTENACIRNYLLIFNGKGCFISSELYKYFTISSTSFLHKKKITILF